MKILNYIIAGFTCVAMGACTKMLELEPVSQISNSSFWKTESDALGGVTGMYATLRPQSTNNLFLWGEGRSDAMGNNLAAPVFQNWNENILTQDNSGTIFTGAKTSWAGMYSLIHAANLVIKNVPNITVSSEAKKNTFLAEAYAMRAYAYFVLVKTFGGVPLMTEPVSGDLGNVQKPKAGKAEVFALIKDDIEKALSLFPDNSFPAGRATWSAPAVQALKAEVYLWTAKREGGGDADLNTVLTAITEVEKADVQLLPNFGDVFEYTNKGNKEILFSIRRKFEETTEPTIYAWMYILDAWVPAGIDPATKAEIEPTAGAPYWAPSAIARNKFTPGDLRKHPTLIEIYDKDDQNNDVFLVSVVAKFNGIAVAGQRYFIDDYIVFRYADVVLMKAEAKNALGQDPSAEINMIRQRAFGNAYPGHEFVNGTQAENDEAILDERFRELMFEGKRWWDLVRFGKAFELVPSLQGKNDENLLLFPIPIETLSLNNQLKQNPGYEN